MLWGAIQYEVTVVRVLHYLIMLMMMMVRLGPCDVVLGRPVGCLETTLSGIDDLIMMGLQQVGRGSFHTLLHLTELECLVQFLCVCVCMCVCK